MSKRRALAAAVDEGFDDGAERGWYINLQEPFRRNERRFHYMDLMLDVVVDVERRWRWKDEDARP